MGQPPLTTRCVYVRQQVHEGRLGLLKDDESRVVLILKPLAPLRGICQPE